MRLKIHLLTILVSVLTVLSFYLVITDPTPRSELQGHLVQFVQGVPVRAETAAFILPISEPTFFPIRDTAVPVPELTVKSFLVYDTKNEKVIFSKEPGRVLPVASLTKLLTAIIGIDFLEPQEVITISNDSYNVDGEGADFRLQEQFYFKDLLGAMLVKSSNDAALAIAKTLEQKTGENFVGLMNRRARQIGMTESRFIDPAGLGDDGFSTARDLLRLARYSKNYPEVWHLLGLRSLDINAVDGKLTHHFESTNKLWASMPNLKGGKTGYTDGALGCMILEEDLPEQDSSLIIIVLGSADRFGEVKKLSDWSKLAFRWR
ncbi:MAG: hypothetical protein A3C71_02205 [Candidatus Yanofskybacteria bacterium RIFCSPHIGHO2_02_FULL_43_15c]|uniref:Peptidase S11 D-alanyl-D-alanine carboxypeptidase A N-terminal domain-containing protein n=1 Tax=Candidatus Yanofskybacteria bacterium RIFCSPHIGHO2_02_FULL_43_15c TaxID=1802679 RepID=A0A1F8FL31_9BACT|nr:MAG: hypothetical protein A3C71_02205 [Candidatus Yanofskybacteria bacterium RIFCSPHIGHO2_02_FULL_43_15c]